MAEDLARLFEEGEPIAPQEDLAALWETAEPMEATPLPEWSVAELPPGVKEKEEDIKNAQFYGAFYNVDPFSAFLDLEEINTEASKIARKEMGNHLKSILRPVPALAAAGYLKAASYFAGLGDEELDVVTAAGYKEPPQTRAERWREDVALVESQIMKEEPLERGSWSEGVRNAFVSSYTTAPAYMIGLLVKGHAIALGLMGVQAGAQKGAELQEAGYGDLTATAGALVSGGSEVLTEMIPFGAFVDIMKKSPGVGKSLVTFFIGEQVGEQINTVIDSVLDKVTLSPDMTWDDYLLRVVQTAKATLVQTAVMGTAATGTRYAIESGEMDRVVENMPEEVKGQFEEIKAQKKGVDDLKATVESLNELEATPEGKEYIDSEVKAIQDEKAGVAPEVTMEEVMRRITEEDLSEEELAGLMEQFAAGRELIAEEMVAEPVEAIKERLLNVGLPEEQATANAALYDGFRVLAKRAGVSVEDVMARYLPEVTREEAAAPEITDADRAEVAANALLSERITTEEQIADTEQLRTYRDEISSELEEQREDLTEEEVAEREEAIDFLDKKIAGVVGIDETTLERETVFSPEKEGETYNQDDNGEMTLCDFKGSCDRFRRTEQGEKVWQEMMKTRQEITEEEFLENVNVEDILDEDETWEQYKEVAEMEGDPVRMYKSEQENIYFFQHAGFEFIWQKPTEQFLQTQEGVTAPRGRIRIVPEGINIGLLKEADQSTFVHETGHLYFRMMQDLSQLESASPELKADFETLKKWLKYEEGKFSVEQQEQFARGFEAYLREGKAPNKALRQAFENFKQWLMQVYRSLRDLNVELTPEVRGVMDRMLADEGVEVAEREGILPERVAGETFEQAPIQRKKDLQTQKASVIVKIERDIQKVKEGKYVPEQVPARAKEGIESANVGQALDFLTGFHEELSEVLPDREVRNTPTDAEQAQREKLKAAEAEALKEWAQENNFWRDSTAFYSQWEKQGKLGGSEHLVILSPGGKTVRKVATARMNSTLHEYLTRLAIHNFYFPEASYRFIGMSENQEGNPIIMVEQTSIDMSDGSLIKPNFEVEGQTPGQLRAKAHEEMKKLGFEEKIFSDYQNRIEGGALTFHYFVNEEGVVIYDLHHENVIHRPDGTIDFIDPVIILDPSTQLERLQKLLEEETTGIEDIGEEIDFEGIEGVEEFLQAAPKKITNIRQLAKKLGGIDYNRENLKGELRKLIEDAPATRYIINKKNKGITLDGLLEAAIEEGILSETSSLDDVVNALKINLETPEAIQEKVAKEERAEKRIAEKAEKTEDLRKAFVDMAKKARKAYKEGKDYASVKEARKLKNILARSRKVRLVRDYFNLTDADLKKIARKNPLLLSQYEFKLYLDDVRKKAVELSEEKLEKAILIKTIHDKDLKRVDNYRRVLGFPTISKMTTDQARQFAEALEPFHDGDTFLSERELETVDRTDLEGIKTWREAKERLSKEIGVSMEELETIKVKEWDEYKWDTALAESNPFYKMLVNETTRKLLEADFRYHEIQNEVYRLARASEKSRGRTLVERAIPQDRQVMEYMETPIEERDALIESMTPEQIDFANYMEQYFRTALEYLIKTKSLSRGRENYFVHMRRTFLENVKEEGLVKAFKDLFRAYQEDEAVFNIMDEDTGNILPLEKFFQFSLRRTGGIDPTTNVTKAFLVYAQMMEKKISLDELIPKMDIYAQSITPEIYTPRGLEIDRSIKKFANKYINNKKGRRIRWIAKQGGTIDVSIRGLKTFTTLIDLGFNIPSGIAAFTGEQVTNFEMLGTKGYAKGTARIKTAKGKAILNKYEAFVGRSAWEEFTAPGKQITERISDGIFGLFHEASVLANKQFLLGAITEEEYNSGELSSERLAQLKIEMGRFRVVPGTKSMVGSTSAGAALMQYKTWASPIIRTVSKDITTLLSDLRAKPAGEALTTREAREIYRLIGLTTTVLIVGATALGEEDDETFIGQVLKRIYRESMTLLQGVDPSMWLGTPRLVGFFKQLGDNIKSIVLLEEYKTKPGLKGVYGLQKQLTPRAVKQFIPEPKKREVLK